MPLANYHFGGHCNITYCCKSHHETTAKVIVNPTSSFLRKSRWKDPPRKVLKRKLFPSTSYGDPSATDVHRCCVKQPPKINFLHYISVTAVKCIIVPVQRNIFKGAKQSQKGVTSQNIRHFISMQWARKVNTILCTCVTWGWILGRPRGFFGFSIGIWQVITTVHINSPDTQHSGMLYKHCDTHNQNNIKRVERIERQAPRSKCYISVGARTIKII